MKIKYLLRNIALVLISMIWLVSACNSAFDRETQEILSFYLADVHQLKINEATEKKLMIINTRSCTSCFDLNPQLRSELNLDYLIIVGSRGDEGEFTDSHFSCEMLFDTNFEYQRYNHGFGKPVYIRIYKGEIRYLELKDENYEVSDFNI